MEKHFFMVTKEKFQNMILSFNLNNNCKSLFFGTHYHGFSIQISKIKIENRCYGNKLKNKVFFKNKVTQRCFYDIPLSHSVLIRNMFYSKTIGVVIRLYHLGTLGFLTSYRYPWGTNS